MSDYRTLLHTAVNQRYRVRRCLGQGFSAWIYEVEDGARGVRAALRVYPPLAPGLVLPDFGQAMPHHSEYLVQGLALGEIQGGDMEGWPFVVTELGAAPLDDATIDPEVLRTALVPVGRALVRLHELGLSHQNISLSNIIQFDKTWKLADFSLDVRDDSGPLMTALRRQRLHRSPPEVVRGEVGPKADVWMLGALIQSRLMVTEPFARGEAEDVVEQLLSSAPQVRADLPAPFDIVVMGCLQRDPDKRWSAAQLLDVLEGRPALRPGGIEEKRSTTARPRLLREVRSEVRPTEPVALCPWPEQVVVGTAAGHSELWSWETPENRKWHQLPAGIRQLCGHPTLAALLDDGTVWILPPDGPPTRLVNLQSIRHIDCIGDALYTMDARELRRFDMTGRPIRRWPLPAAAFAMSGSLVGLLDGRIVHLGGPGETLLRLPAVVVGLGRIGKDGWGAAGADGSLYVSTSQGAPEELPLSSPLCGLATSEFFVVALHEERGGRLYRRLPDGVWSAAGRFGGGRLVAAAAQPPPGGRAGAIVTAGRDGTLRWWSLD